MWTSKAFSSGCSSRAVAFFLMTTHAVTANTSGHDRVGHIAGYGAITARLGKRPSVCTSVKLQFLKLVRALSGYRFFVHRPIADPEGRPSPA